MSLFRGCACWLGSAGRGLGARRGARGRTAVGGACRPVWSHVEWAGIPVAASPRSSCGRVSREGRAAMVSAWGAARVTFSRVRVLARVDGSWARRAERRARAGIPVAASPRSSRGRVSRRLARTPRRRVLWIWSDGAVRAWHMEGVEFAVADASWRRLASCWSVPVLAVGRHEARFRAFRLAVAGGGSGLGSPRFSILVGFGVRVRAARCGTLGWAHGGAGVCIGGVGVCGCCLRRRLARRRPECGSRCSTLGAPDGRALRRLLGCSFALGVASPLCWR